MSWKYYIGIDPGVKTGFCVWSKEDRNIRHLRTIPIHEAMEAVKYWHIGNPGQVLVPCEDQTLIINKFIFNRMNNSPYQQRLEDRSRAFVMLMAALFAASLVIMSACALFYQVHQKAKPETLSVKMQPGEKMQWPDSLDILSDAKKDSL